MGWKSTVDITRADAYNMIALYFSTAMQMSDSELTDLLETLGYGDNPKLPYIGHNFNIIHP